MEEIVAHTEVKTPEIVAHMEEKNPETAVNTVVIVVLMPFQIADAEAATEVHRETAAVNTGAMNVS